jgi:VanZ family protein
MAQRPHLAAPLLLAVAILLILYVSLYPFRFEPDGPSMLAAVELLTWARASRSDMLNNVLLYMPLGFCVALIVEPRFGRAAAMGAALIAGAALSLSMELLQASIAPRVPSLTDLTLNAVGALAGTLGGSAWHAFGSRIAPQGAPVNRARAVAVLIVALWLVMRLWPLLPDASLGQLKRAVRPLFTPHIRFAETAGYLIGWLIVSEAVFHLVRRQRAVDVLLVIIAVVLVGRTFVAGSMLTVDLIAALVLLLPSLLLISRLGERPRAALLAALLVTWLAWPAVVALTGGGGRYEFAWPELPELLTGRPSLPLLAGKAFSYLALGWLLAGAGLLPHVAAGITMLLALLFLALSLGTASAPAGWAISPWRSAPRSSWRGGCRGNSCRQRGRRRAGSPLPAQSASPAALPSISRRTSGSGGPPYESSVSWNSFHAARPPCVATQSSRSLRIISLPRV